MDSRGRGDDVEEEATGRYHVTDYAHVYRKVNGNTRHVSVSKANKEFLKFATGRDMSSVTITCSVQDNHESGT